MSSSLPSFILGYHGCDKKTGENILAGNPMQISDNDYDWLGPGAYFWENSPQRALEFAIKAKNNPKITRGKISSPFVIGAVISPENCLDLTDAKSIEIVKKAHLDFIKVAESLDYEIPVNKDINGSGDFLIRHLDCAVIHYLHAYRKIKKLPPFDTVRGVFMEGQPIYKTSGFRERTHIQICVMDIEKCIKGFFRPLPIVNTV